MEAFETIRVAATQLNEELVSAGCNALDPASLVDAAIIKLDLEVVLLPPGDLALKGAQALFDDQRGTILCEDLGTRVEQSLVIAHEIGHARIHGGSCQCMDQDIDITSPMEAAPVGLQRVEDYGVRERHELQANIFAREFLLPRSGARELYLVRGMGAIEIASQTGLPLNLVRQQIYDAILLPPVPIEAPVPAQAPAKPLSDDPSQDRAVRHRSAPFQLQAGPGTGKTRTLVKRVISLLDEGIDPAAILIMTFSNRAAGELLERITAVAPDAAPKIWIGTFHAFGLDLVRRYHDRMGLPPSPLLFDRSDAIEVLEDILPTLPLVHYRDLWDPARILREIIQAISRAKDELTSPERYRELSQKMLDAATDVDSRKAAEKCLEIAAVYELYESALDKFKGVDFGDLIMRPTLLLESDQAIRATVQLRHRHVLVDEYQDLNRASAGLLKAIAGDGKRLWVVGDARQSIYRFRGASSANMIAFKDDYANAVTDQLGVNYRSTEQIVQAVVGIAPNMGASNGMLPLQLAADRGSGPTAPQIRRLETLEDECGALAASIRDAEVKHGVRLRDQAILCRTNKRLNELSAGLEARGIPVLHLGSIFERQEIRDLLSLMSFVVDPFGSALIRIGGLSRYSATLQDTYLAIQHIKSAGEKAFSLLGALPSIAGLSPQGAAGFERLVEDLKGIAPSDAPWEFLATYLLDRSDYLRSLVSDTSIAARMRGVAIWQFLNFVRLHGPKRAGLPIQQTLDRVRQMVLLAEERDLRQVPAAALHLNAVRLMTVHGSKGLEFEAVHLPGLTSSSFPSSYSGHRCPPPTGMIDGDDEISVDKAARIAHAQEEQCLFFVGLSRARTHLRIYLARKQRNGNNRSASPYLDWVLPSFASELAQPPVMDLPNGIDGPPQVVLSPPVNRSVTDSQLALFEKCPIRYFYTYVLGLAGGRKQTAFSRTHDCVHELLRWLQTARLQVNPQIEAVEAQFDVIWQDRGPIRHAYAEDYRKLASRLIRTIVNSGSGRTFLNLDQISVEFANGRIIVEPSDVFQTQDGIRVLRRMRTGHRRQTEYDNIEYALYVLASRAYQPQFPSVQAVHLTDEIHEPVVLTDLKLKTRKEATNEMLGLIAAGLFEPKIDAYRCPRCPHFFICPSLPAGSLKLGDPS